MVFTCERCHSPTARGMKVGFNSQTFALICRLLQPSLSDSDDLEEMERLRKEHIEALREIKKLQVEKLRLLRCFRMFPLS